MEILPVVKLMEEDLEPLDAENESEEEGDTIEMDIKDEVLPELKTDKPSIPEEDIFVEKEKPKEKPKKEKKTKNNSLPVVVNFFFLAGGKRKCEPGNQNGQNSDPKRKPFD